MMRRATTTGALLMLFTAAAGCAPPVGITRVSPREEYRQYDANAITTGAPSDASQTVLRRYNLVEAFDADPVFTIGRLREITASGGGGSDEIFALAELSYLYAARARSRPDALAAALYAYAYLFPNDPAQRPQAI